MKRARLLLISLFNFCILVAQPTYQIKHYSVNDGMSQGIVQTIIQDKKVHRHFRFSSRNDDNE